MKIVMHICCGVCAAGAIERLREEENQIVGFFYNPNIHPEAEYTIRLETTRNLAKELNFPLEVGLYEPQQWFEETVPFKNEPEGGKRCTVCFRKRLRETHRFMRHYGFDAFSTTLTISPKKSAKVINEIGNEIGGDTFLARDFKKKEGFKRAVQLARQFDLYRQNYCGCIYSMR